MISQVEKGLNKNTDEIYDKNYRLSIFI